MRDKITCLLNKNWLVKEWLSRQLAPRDGWHNGYVLSQTRVAYEESCGHYQASRQTNNMLAELFLAITCTPSPLRSQGLKPRP